MNDLYHCCRWCKWFEKGCCIHDSLSKDGTGFHPFYEDGILSEAIKEGFGSQKFNALKAALAESGLSKKKQNAVLTVFFEELDTITTNWVEAIDERVSLALEAFNFGDDGVKIADPHSFYCKNFL